MAGRAAGLVGALVALAWFAVGCGATGSSPSLRSALVTADALGPSWEPFTASDRTPSTDLCGNEVPRHREARESTSVAFAIDPADGPIFGERISRYGSRSEVDRIDRALARLDLPCQFTDASGARWRTSRIELPSPAFGGHALLVESLDRSDSFNYEVSATSGRVRIAMVLNVRRPEPDLLARITTLAFTKADRHDLIVGRSGP